MTAPAGPPAERYHTDAILSRTLRVRYPLTEGRIVLRTELDWDRDLEAESVSDDGTTFTFRVEARKPFLYFKPCWRVRDEERWAVGANSLLLMTGREARDSYPFFNSSEMGTFTPVEEFDSAILGRKHRLCAYVPPGYHENTLRRYSVLYMQDGQNLFFPDQAFMGRDWNVEGSIQILDRMNAIEQAVVIGIYSGDRMAEYTKPGYETYARSVVEELVPVARTWVRLLDGPGESGVMGSSLGGVVSFFMAWQYPEVFGVAACMSSTFSHKDDLIERVLSEPKNPAKFYLDSGWPEDNFEVTLAMAVALQQRNYVFGQDFIHFAFPLQAHEEGAWARRIHLPMQLFWGKFAAARHGRAA